jgi:hypothetical protein
VTLGRTAVCVHLAPLAGRGRRRSLRMRGALGIRRPPSSRKRPLARRSPCELCSSRPVKSGAGETQAAAPITDLHLSNSPPSARHSFKATASRARRRFRARFALSFRPRTSEMPDGRCIRGRLCSQKSTGVSNQGYTATAGIPRTMVLRLIRDPGDRAFLPPSSAVRVHQLNLAPASCARTTRFRRPQGRA